MKGWFDVVEGNEAIRAAMEGVTSNGVVVPGLGFFIIGGGLKSMKQSGLYLVRGMGMKSGGFTLVEVMVVVVILGILAAVVVPSFMDRPDQARHAKAKQDVRSLVSAVNLYRLDNNQFPGSLYDLVGPYLDIPPLDPWGNAYVYVFPGVQGRFFDIASYGADGGEGGSGFDEDIVSWRN